MDVLRSCYKSQMAIFPDRPDVLVDGEWHWCVDNAQVVPYGTPFVSNQWDPYGWELEGQYLGEHERGGYTKGTNNPRNNGRHVCGTPAQWREGTPFAEKGIVPVDAENVPLCCDAQPLILLGGLAADGTTRQTWYPGQYTIGGMSADGTAPQIPGWYIQAFGGLTADGVARQYLGPTQFADGGLTADGVARQNDSPEQLANGGLAANGTAPQIVEDPSTDFCGFVGMPETLYLYLSGVGPLDQNTFTLNWDGTKYALTQFTVCSPLPLTMELRCVDDVLTLYFTNGGTLYIFGPDVPPTPPPGFVWFNGDALFTTGCDGNYEITIDETAPPP